MGAMKYMSMVPRNQRGTLSLGLIADVKGQFFDRGRVMQAMDAATHRAMEQAARFIRRRAQTSMRYVTDVREQARQVEQGKRKRAPRAHTPSRPGEPPRAVRPHAYVREHLYYAYDPGARRAVIGPARLPRSTDAPETLEFGGAAMIRNPRRSVRRLGRGGEIRVGGLIGPTTKMAEGTDVGNIHVTYARLSTFAQVDRANRINERLYGPLEQRRRIAARPFMGPALEAEAPQLPGLFARAMKG
jgi:hypothetical protein